MTAQPSAPLVRFLATEDLDDLLEARDDLGALSDDDLQVVRAVLAAWRDEQAVSNLLIHPELIPRDLRIATLTRGMNQREQVYYILAAVVGVGSLEGAELSAAEREALRDSLLELIGLDESEDAIIAKRASVSLPVVLTAPDAPSVCQLLDHRAETVRHNLLAWLLHEFAADLPTLHRLVDESDIGSEAQARVKSQIANSLERRRKGDFDSLSGPLLSWIPNLSHTR